MLCKDRARNLAVFALLGMVAGCSGESGEGGGAVSPTVHEKGLSAYVDSVAAAIPDEEDSGAYQAPDSEELESWAEAVRRLDAGEVASAERWLRDNLSTYRAARIEPPDGEGFAVIEPRNSEDNPGWGWVVVNNEARRPLVAEVPHPLFDRAALAEGALIFADTEAQVLIVGGTHRCANQSDSPCQGKTTVCDGQQAPFRISDMAHSPDSPFQTAHRVVMAERPDRAAVSLHGNANPDCGDLFVSSGVSGTATQRAQTLAEAVPESTGLEVSVESTEAECPLVGTTNLQGRLTNGSPKPCSEPAESASDRFLHLEQSLRLREDHPSVVVDALKAAVPMP